MALKISTVPDQYSPTAWRQIVRDVDARFRALEAATGKYTVSNFTPTRTLDASTATLADVANFVATLVSDMQGAGRLGK